MGQRNVVVVAGGGGVGSDHFSLHQPGMEVPCLSGT